jgi:hypothetical protein
MWIMWIMWIMERLRKSLMSRAARRCLAPAVAAAVVFLSVVFLSAGCYRHVVDVDGIGPMRDVDVYEPNYSGEPLPGERALDSMLGEKPSPKIKPSSVKK